MIDTDKIRAKNWFSPDDFGLLRELCDEVDRLREENEDLRTIIERMNQPTLNVVSIEEVQRWLEENPDD
jgi:hypothetical protein